MRSKNNTFWLTMGAVFIVLLLLMDRSFGAEYPESCPHTQEESFNDLKFEQQHRAKIIGGEKGTQWYYDFLKQAEIDGKENVIKEAHEKVTQAGLTVNRIFAIPIENLVTSGRLSPMQFMMNPQIHNTHMLTFFQDSCYIYTILIPNAAYEIINSGVHKAVPPKKGKGT